MTLRDLFCSYAPDMLVSITLCDKSNSVYCLLFNFEDPDDHDFKIFEKYSDARVLEWYVVDGKYIVNGTVNVTLDIEKF